MYGVHVCLLTDKKARRMPGFCFAMERLSYRCLMISSANSLHFTSVAPSIKRAKS